MPKIAGTRIASPVSNIAMRPLLIGVLLACAGAAQSPSWQELKDSGRKAYLQGKYSEAEKLFESAVAEAEKTPDDRNRAIASLQLLAMLYRTTGAYEKALPLLAQVVDLRKRDGEDTAEFADAVTDLASTNRAAGNAKGALLLFQQASTIRHRLMGMQNPELAKDWTNMALCWVDLQDFSAAASLYQSALYLLESAHGADSQLVLPALDALVHTYMAVNQYAEAEPYLRRALTIRERTAGPKSADLIPTLDNLAYAYFGLKRYQESENLYSRLLKIWEENAGADHPMVALTLDKMVELMTAEEKFNEADCVAERAVHIRTVHLANGYARQGVLFAKEDKPEMAAPLFQRALELDADSEYALKGYAVVLKRLHRDQEAAMILKKLQPKK